MLPNLPVTTVILLLVTMSDILVINLFQEMDGTGHMYSSTPDLPVDHTIRELALCRDDNSTFLLTSVEMSQIIEYLYTIQVLENYS